MNIVTIPLDIDHTCAEKGPVTYNGPPFWTPIGKGTRPNECPACCYERGYLDARPWLKKVGEKATT